MSRMKSRCWIALKKKASLRSKSQVIVVCIIFVTLLAHSFVIFLERREDPMFHLCVHEIEGGVDLEVAVSMIVADISAETSEDPPQQRRSRRKKKEPGNFPTHSVSVPKDCNIAHLRLIVHEKTGKRLLRQCLHLIRENAAEDQSAILELSEKDNSKDFSEFASDNDQMAPTLFRLAMTYKDAEVLGEQNGGKTGTRKRPPKVDVEQEESLMSMLTELAFRGKLDDYDVGNGKKKKKRREERGFRGTFLHSASPSKDESNTTADDKDQDGKEADDSIQPEALTVS